MRYESFWVKFYRFMTPERVEVGRFALGSVTFGVMAFRLSVLTGAVGVLGVLNGVVFTVGAVLTPRVEVPLNGILDVLGLLLFGVVVALPSPPPPPPEQALKVVKLIKR